MYDEGVVVINDFADIPAEGAGFQVAVDCVILASAIPVVCDFVEHRFVRASGSGTTGRADDLHFAVIQVCKFSVRAAERAFF